MQVTQNSKAFQPVTVTLDSQYEVNTFIEMMNIAFRFADSGSDEERLAVEIRDSLNNVGWQSSSMSC